MFLGLAEFVLIESSVVHTFNAHCAVRYPAALPAYGCTDDRDRRNSTDAWNGPFHAVRSLRRGCNCSTSSTILLGYHAFVRTWLEVARCRILKFRPEIAAPIKPSTSIAINFTAVVVLSASNNRTILNRRRRSRSSAAGHSGQSRFLTRSVVKM
ncbi:hypothetical protein B0O99DRAFT_645894 [Bisporella sp. PMI_857]|nr:hypothetical protein B0O99DRAFT_645894 [Bisporella sp. PMI_857]